MDPFPRGARTDLFRMKKAGFGLAEMIRARLGSLFNFVEWQHPKDWAKFCGMYERQMPDGPVLVQQDAYA